MSQLSKLVEWKALEKQAKNFTPYSSLDFEAKPQSEKIESQGIALDFSHQRMDKNVLELLQNLAEAVSLKEKIKDLFQGKKVNRSKNLPALHTALRAKMDEPILVDGKNIMSDIQKVRKKMAEISDKIRAGKWVGSTNKKITHIVNIGIGGSDLGPRFCVEALDAYTSKDLSYHFISDADPHSFDKVTAHLNPQTTLFIISSKSFTTKETLYNTKKAIQWIHNPEAFDKHFIAVTAEAEKARALGFKQILAIWDWVGGRYSTCSAINLITAIAIGYEQFSFLLEGALGMDEHFQSASFATNLPVLLALIGLWNTNFLHINNLLMLTYSSHLNHFVDYVQQLDMESNGKSLDMEGKAVNYSTGPIVWGGNGNQAQHSYFQLLCQGTHQVAIDIISVNTLDKSLINAICRNKKTTLTEGYFDETDPNGFIPGKLPLNHLHLPRIDPKTIGALIALYEHKIYSQSVLWNINPFDQPGVESAKKATVIEAD